MKHNKLFWPTVANAATEFKPSHGALRCVNGGVVPELFFDFLDTKCLRTTVRPDHSLA